MRTLSPMHGAGVWLLDISAGIPEDEYRFWQTFLSPERRARLERFHFRADALRSLAGEILARYAVAARLDRNPRAVRFAWSAYGKPEVVGGGMHFNISHSDALVACAVSERPVGVDVEYAAGGLAPDLLKHFASAGEMRFFEGREASETSGIALWTLKESLLKALGTGITDNLRDLDFSAFLSKWTGGAASFSAHGFHFTLFFRGDYAVAVCAGGSDGDASATVSPEVWTTSVSCEELIAAMRHGDVALKHGEMTMRRAE